MNAIKHIAVSHFLVIACLIMISFGYAEAKVLSQSEPEVTQIKIVTSPHAQDRNRPTAWGVDSTYIGPGDILKLIRIDIYLDSYNRLSSVKVTRLTNIGDTMTLLFADVKELSIQTLKKGGKRQHKKIPIFIHTADSLTFP